MLKKIIIFLCFYFSTNIYGQDLTIFFLKDGSILQGKIVNENQNRIFLKTDQGTIKIIPSDVLGREDTARKGDLTYFSDRLDQLNSNVRYLTGQVNHLKDSLSFSIGDLNNLFLNIEAIQNEFEIELLRLQSKTRQHNQNLEYNKDDLINNRVKIAEHNQKIGGLSDTLRTLDNLVKKMNEKLNSNMDKSYLLSGNLVTTKNEIKDLYIDQEKSQNQIDMMAGALANNIQEVIQVQGRFSDVENGVKENSTSIKDLNRALIIQKEDLVLLVNSNYNSVNDKIVKLNDELEVLKQKIDSLDKKSETERDNLLQNLNDLKSKLEILNEKVLSYNRQNKLAEEKLLLLDENISAVNKKLIKMESSAKKLSNEIIEIELKLDANTNANEQK
ncbi:MAG: hypothetical protein CMF99_00855 [Candidatus Marinimicrobia bacterium]|nr:hypothetical protein [Candidatus Neomarinimicrobiota bacterium]|tara:strand:- start:4322 stop:5482 length:1161 start_codon:yes stop_codon:yes gene_type:complete